jgi:MATE family multidrug resistance protein
MTQTSSANEQAFRQQPHRTLILLAFPVLLSLIAEPLTGLIDTAFVAQLGSEPLAALGVGTAALSSIFWVFNFLGIGTQTEVAQALGRHENQKAADIGSLAILLALGGGMVLIVVCFPALPLISQLMGAQDAVHGHALAYMQLRLLGAPAVLVTIAAFGILRGLQDMRSPLIIAVGVNALNILLDYLLIFGAGPIPAWGVRGAALASSISQWLGAMCVLWMVHRQLGLSCRLHARDMLKLLRIGRDLFIRTGVLTAFLLLTTRAATQMGPEAGAAHQAIRQFFIFAALFLDAFAVAGQSLVAYFKGAEQFIVVKQVAWIVCLWSLLTGILLAAGMWAGRSFFVQWLVPDTAASVFLMSWLVSACFQPLNALAFATDGIHWGTGDFAYLRNMMLLATLAGGVAILSLKEMQPDNLVKIWMITGAWVGLRAVFGVIRIWPGYGYYRSGERVISEKAT